MHQYATNGFIVKRLIDKESEKDTDDSKNASIYLSTFRAMEQRFFDEVHPFVDMGLAMKETRDAGSNPPNIFTVHGSQHISDLIQSLDRIAESIEDHSGHEFSVLECYILLSAAHIHDSQNVSGRRGHPQRSNELIHKYRDLFVRDSPTLQYIFDIASAHGGEHEIYKDDTFRAIESDNSSNPRLHLLASMLRIGDELSENSSRVPQSVTDSYDHSGRSKLAHAYAHSFTPFKFRKESLKLVFNLYPEIIELSVPIGDSSQSFVEFLEEKIDRIETESRYCSQYGRPFFNISQIDIIINQYSGPMPSKMLCDPIRFSLYLNYGYPKSGLKLCDRSPELKNKHISSLDQLFQTTKNPTIDLKNTANSDTSASTLGNKQTTGRIRSLLTAWKKK